MIELKELSKKFGKRAALDSVCLRVAKGSIFGLLGHNGAGKSTAIGLLLGHLHPDQGGTWINGHSVQEDRRRAVAGVGAIFEAPAFYPYLSGWRNLEILAACSGRVAPDEIRDVVRTVGLEERIGDRVKTYSHGMRCRLALAQAMLPTPGVLILDEPTDGLDPQGIHEIRNLILRLHEQHGLTILLSSHLLGEVEQICHEIGILHRGRLLYHGDWRKQRNQEARWKVELAHPDQARGIWNDLLQAGWIADLESGHPIQFQIRGPGRIDRIVEKLAAAGAGILRVEPEEPGLEEFYLQVLRQGEEARVEGAS